MNFIRPKVNKFTTAICSLVICSSLLSACGGSGGGSDTTAGIGGTGIAVGKVTDFGSIFVNGSIFNINQAQFLVDGEENVGQAGQDTLSIGMVVLVKAETNNGVFTGEALEVFYDDEVQGPITSVIPDPMDATLKVITVFGQTITIDDTDTLFADSSGSPDPNYGFATLAAGDVIEVSGFRTSPIEITATYVEKTDDLDPGFSEVELHGTISQFSAMNQNFMLDGVLITFDNMTDIEVSGVLDNGLFVEVEGIYFDNPSVFVHAEEIEEEEEGFGDDVDDVSLQGVISVYMGDDDFEINGQAIDASGASITPAGATLSDGLEVEVEGDIDGGVLIAEEVEVREGETKLQTTVSPGSVDVASFEVFYPVVAGTIVINVDAQTLFKDEAGAIPLQNFSINDLNGNDFVKIEGQEVNGEVVASIVKRIDPEIPEKYKLKGVVDAFVPASWIEVLGIRYNVDGDMDTDYEDDTGTTVTEVVFFGLLQVGDLVEIEDQDFRLGYADEVELE